MPIHTPNFAETCDNFVGFGLDRETDENTLMWYVRRFSDAPLMKTLTNRMSDAELEELFSMISRLLKTHLSEDEYHRLFLKET